MSIDRDLDDYLEQRGITPSAEVVPDHACQIFEEATPDTGTAVGELDDARELVERLLGQPGTAGSSGA